MEAAEYNCRITLMGRNCYMHSPQTQRCTHETVPSPAVCQKRVQVYM